MPSVVRSVHYVSEGSAVRADGTQKYPSVCRAAIITEVYDPADGQEVGLCVLNPTGLFFKEHCHYDEGTCEEVEPDVFGPPVYQPGTWHWPERV